MLEIEDPKLCGIGEGAKCCAFLAGSPARFLCGRTIPDVYAAILLRLDEGTMGAKYAPETPFPECQSGRPT